MNSERRSLALIAGALLTLAGFTSAAAAEPGAIVVDTLADAVADDGACSLREAIGAANTDTAGSAAPGECPAGAGADTITFSVAGTITLAGSGLPDITADLVIDGGGSITIDGAEKYDVRPVTVAAGDVTLDGLTIARGSSGTRGGGVRSLPAATLTITRSTIKANWANDAGGVWSQGPLTVIDSVITDNFCVGVGGGIHSESLLRLEGSTISDNFGVEGGGLYVTGAATVVDTAFTANRADSSAAAITNRGDLKVTRIVVSDNIAAVAIFNLPDGTMTIKQSEIRDNRGSYTSSRGIENAGTMTIIDSSIVRNGGISNFGVLTMTGSTVARNAGHRGGGLRNEGTASIANSTFAGNGTPQAGGGISHVAGELTLRNVTISDNRALYAGGGLSLRAPARVSNTLVIGNTAPRRAEIDGTLADDSHSLLGIPAGLTLDDILDPAGLADNGGPTRTIALVETADNPAREGADPAVCAAPPVGGIDQRGRPRPANACDVGAFELAAAVPSPSPSSSPPATPGPSTAPSASPAPTPVPGVTLPPTATATTAGGASAPGVPAIPALLLLVVAGLGLFLLRRRSC